MPAASQTARRENIEKINVCKLSKKFSSSVGSGLGKAEHDHENVAKSKAGRLQRFMCEQSCHKIVGNFRTRRERATWEPHISPEGDPRPPSFAPSP